MNLAKRMILAIAVAAAAIAPGRSAAKSFYVTPGFGLGSIGGSKPNLAVGLSCTYRDGAPSISARYTHTQEIDLFGNTSERATELAALVGLTTFGEDGASAGIHLGLGRVRSTSHTLSWMLFYFLEEEVTTTEWGLALQVDTFMKRVGLSFGANFNDSATFWTLLLSVRIGNVYDD